jgi:hypothetical protein
MGHHAERRWVSGLNVRRRAGKLLRGIEIDLLGNASLRRLPDGPQVCVSMAGLIDESGRRRTGKCVASCQDQRQNKTAQTLGHISILFNPSLPSRCRSHRQEMELPLVDLAFSYYIFGGD